MDITTVLGITEGAALVGAVVAHKLLMRRVYREIDEADTLREFEKKSKLLSAPDCLDDIVHKPKQSKQ